MTNMILTLPPSFKLPPRPTTTSSTRTPPSSPSGVSKISKTSTTTTTTLLNSSSLSLLSSSSSSASASASASASSEPVLSTYPSCSFSIEDVARKTCCDDDDDNDSVDDIILNRIRENISNDDMNNSYVNTIRALLRQSAKRFISTTPAGKTNNNNNSNNMTDCHFFWVPGRIEVVGKHTDYAGGSSVVCASTRGFAVVSRPRSDSKCRVLTRFPSCAEDVDGGDDYLECCVDLCSDGFDESSMPSWAKHMVAVIQRLHTNFNIENGCDVSISTNLPPSSGMSSSSAMVCLMFMVLDTYNEIRGGNDLYKGCIGGRGVVVDDDSDENDDCDLYTYLGNIENGRDYHPGTERTLPGTKSGGGVGTFGGSEDHTAIMSGENNTLKMFNYCPTKYSRQVSVDATDVAFVIAVSGVRADKASVEKNKKENEEEKDTADDGAAQNRYNDAVALATWAAAAYTSSLAEERSDMAQALLGREQLQDLYSGVRLYNPLAPNLSEVVQRERLNIFHSSVVGGHEDDDEFTVDSLDVVAEETNNKIPKLQHQDHEQIRTSISDRIRSMATSSSSWLKSSVYEFMGSNIGFEPSKSGDDVFIDVNDLVTRFEQFYDENEIIVPGVMDSFQAKDYDALGEHVDLSHRLTVEKLQNTTQETEWLPLYARGLNKDESDGNNDERVTALASSAFGAGFGGSCWALVRKDDAEQFCSQWSAAYDERFPPSPCVGSKPLRREFFVMNPGCGAFAL